MKRKLIEIVLYMWQLPQHLIALLLEIMLKCGGGCYREKSTDDNVFIRWNYGGAMSLGRYIFLPSYARMTTIKHECNHCIQSRTLGPLYLLLIGIPSLVHAGIHTLWWNWFGKTWDYYSFYTEHWMFKD